MEATRFQCRKLRSTRDHHEWTDEYVRAGGFGRRWCLGDHGWLAQALGLPGIIVGVVAGLIGWGYGYQQFHEGLQGKKREKRGSILMVEWLSRPLGRRPVGDVEGAVVDRGGGSPSSRTGSHLAAHRGTTPEHASRRVRNLHSRLRMTTAAQRSRSKRSRIRVIAIAATTGRG